MYWSALVFILKVVSEPKYKSVGECCQYGFKDPLAIVIDLLIDEGIADTAHRKIFFSSISILSSIWQKISNKSNNTFEDYAFLRF